MWKNVRQQKFTQFDELIGGLERIRIPHFLYLPSVIQKLFFDELMTGYFATLWDSVWSPFSKDSRYSLVSTGRSHFYRHFQRWKSIILIDNSTGTRFISLIICTWRTLGFVLINSSLYVWINLFFPFFSDELTISILDYWLLIDWLFDCLYQLPS